LIIKKVAAKLAKIPMMKKIATLYCLKLFVGTACPQCAPAKNAKDIEDKPLKKTFKAMVEFCVDVVKDASIKRTKGTTPK